MWSSAAWPNLATELNDTKLIVSWKRRLPQLQQTGRSQLAGAVRTRAFGCSYSSEELYIAATLRAAELQASRKTQLPELERRVFDLVIPANELVTGWRKGRQLGLIKFLGGA